MPAKGRVSVFLGIAIALLAPIALGESPQIWRPSPGSKNDHRIVKDRLHAQNNPDHGDYSFLNAVGTVWSDDTPTSAAGYMASTGFLIDRCHVLTNLHALYIDDVLMEPSLGKSVSFAVGQTEGYGNRGALQGMKYLLNGVFVAHGDTLIVEHFVQNPENDWAVIRLATSVDGSITPMTLGSVDVAQLAPNRRLSIAGFPADLRAPRRDRLEFKDLWESSGEVVRVASASTRNAIVETTIQAARGSSGSPLYGDFEGRPHLVIGMHEGIRGNGIDVSPDMPNVQILFTLPVLDDIRAAEARSPCT